MALPCYPLLPRHSLSSPVLSKYEPVKRVNPSVETETLPLPKLCMVSCMACKSNLNDMSTYAMRMPEMLNTASCSHSMKETTRPIICQYHITNVEISNKVRCRNDFSTINDSNQISTNGDRQNRALNSTSTDATCPFFQRIPDLLPWIPIFKGSNFSALSSSPAKSLNASKVKREDSVFPCVEAPRSFHKGKFSLREKGELETSLGEISGDFNSALLRPFPFTPTLGQSTKTT
ncbi:hypothetical protein VNO77_19045 [Canavalia gladiata]|uniref:Uncharacterized protein n=1 Tax=Canavalia gladiata TaxID=3824 RepID=A0AAN9QL02_CANGL